VIHPSKLPSINLDVVATRWLPRLHEIQFARWFQVLSVAAIVLAGLAIRLYHLNDIPAATWGDLIEHYRLVHVAWAGKLQLSTWFGGDGPAYTLLEAVFFRLVGLSFLHMKLFSALIGSCLMIVTYLYARALFDRQVALVAALIASVSFWGVSYSRQGKPYILVTVLFGLLLYLLINQRRIWAGLVIGLGMFVQASFWGALSLSFYSWQTALVAWLFSIPAFMKMTDVLNPADYLGNKMNFHLSAFELGRRVVINIFKNIGGFFWQGDPGFRATIPHAPLLDPLSGIFFAAGLAMVVWWVIKAGKRKYLSYILIPFFMVQIPSILDVVNYRFNPNSGRMIGVLPVVYMLVALGLVSIGRKVDQRWVRNVFYGISLCLIVTINLWNYYVVYPRTLPNHNVPFAETIANYLNDSLPQIDHVVMIGCCWGERGQPEPYGVGDELHLPVKFTYVPWYNYSNNVINAYAQNGSLLLILNPNDVTFQERLVRLYPNAQVETIQAGGYKVAQLIILENRMRIGMASPPSGQIKSITRFPGQPVP
jgi:hypothetical protein